MKGASSSERDYSKLYDSLGIVESELPDLSKYYSRAQKNYSPSSKPWGSPERYVKALYWMRFVKKWDWYDIDKATNMHCFRRNYELFGWYNEYKTIEECKQNEVKIRDKVWELIKGMDFSKNISQDPDYLEKLAKIKDVPLQKKTREAFHLSTSREFFNVLYYLVVTSGLVIKDIATYFDISHKSIHNHLAKYGIGLSRKESRRRTEAQGNGNHIKSIQSRQKTVVRQALKYGLSNNYELLFRDGITAFFPDYLDIHDYEIIVGVHTLLIIPPQEIDIPLLIMSKEDHDIYKYAIELNGDIWHERNKINNMRDIKKNTLLDKTTWKHIVISFDHSISAPGKVKEAFVELTQKICMLIAEDIQNYSNSWKDILINGFDNSIMYVK